MPPIYIYIYVFVTSIYLGSDDHHMLQGEHLHGKVWIALQKNTTVTTVSVFTQKFKSLQSKLSHQPSFLFCT